jgi:hypothetical protein
MDEFDKPIEATPPDNKLGVPARRGAPLGILHEWKARLKQIRGEIEAARARPNYDPTSRVIKRWTDEELKLEEEIANVERIREAPRQQTRAETEKSKLLERGKYCCEVIEEVKKIKNLHLGTGRSVPEIQTESPDMAVWQLRKLLTQEDQDTFNHPNQWGPPVGYAKIILAKTSDVSVHTITSRVKAYRKSQRSKKR